METDRELLTKASESYDCSNVLLKYAENYRLLIVATKSRPNTDR